MSNIAEKLTTIAENEQEIKNVVDATTDAMRDNLTDAVNLLDFKTARNRDGYTGTFEFTDTGFTYIGTYYFVFDIALESGKTYILSCDFDVIDGTPTWNLVYADGTRSTAYVNKPITSTSDVVAIWIYPKPGTTPTLTSTFNNLMLEEGDFAHEYIPYGYKEPIEFKEFPEKVEEVYNKGMKREYDRFWDRFQNNGEVANYYFAFGYDRFTDKNYNPKHDIKCSSGTTPGNSMFFNASGITDIKVAVYPNANLTAAFQGCSSLKKIPKIVSLEKTTYSNTFNGCSALEDITFEGVIGNNIEFSHSSKLTLKSLSSIFNALKDLTGTGETRTLTLHAGRKALLESTDEGRALIDMATEQKGWTIA